MRRILAVGAAVLTLTLSAAFPQADMGAAQRRGVKTHIFVAPGIPASVSAASVRVGDGRGLSELTMTVTNETDGELQGLRLAAFIARPSGHLKSGEGWKKEVSVPARSSKTFSFVLRGHAVYGDRAFVALQGADGQAGVWETSLTDVFHAARSSVKSAAYTRPTGERPGRATFVSAGRAGAQGAFCKDALKNASEACRAGIDSFTCDEKNQTFSFTCKEPLRDAPTN